MASCGLNNVQRSRGNACRNAECDGCKPYRAPPMMVATPDMGYGSPTPWPLTTAPLPADLPTPVRMQPDYSQTPLMLEVNAARAKHAQQRYELARDLAIATVTAGRAGDAKACVELADAILDALATSRTL